MAEKQQTGYGSIPPALTRAEWAEINFDQNCATAPTGWCCSHSPIFWRAISRAVWRGRMTRQYVKRSLTIDGVTRRLHEWAEIRGIAYMRLLTRMKAGFSPEAILTDERQPARHPIAAIPGHERVLELPTRIAQRIAPDVASGCWLWTGAKNNHGYAKVGWQGKSEPAHRIVYALLEGAIPPGLHIDHLCRVPRCVNPAHLEPVTPRENTMRGKSPSAAQAQQTHCVHGHAFDAHNTYLWRGFERKCRTCMSQRGKRPDYMERHRVRARERYREQKERSLEAQRA